MARIRSFKNLSAAARKIRVDQGTPYAGRNQLGLPASRPPVPRIPVGGPLAGIGNALSGIGAPAGGGLSSPVLAAARAAQHTPITLLGTQGAATGPAAGGAVGARKPAGQFPSARPPGAPPPVDPLAPLTPAQIQAQVAAAVQAQTNPVLAQIAADNAARTKAAQEAIIGYTNAFAPALQTLGGIGTAGLQTGMQSQAAIDAALQQSLTGGGTAAAADLAAKLAQINAPQADQQAAAQAAIGAGAGNAAFATGSAALSALNAELANARTTNAHLPGIAALYGGQATRDLQAQASRDLAQQQGQVTSQIPGLISSLTQNLQGDARSQANANRTFNEGVREFGVNRADRIAATNAANQTRVAVANSRTVKPLVVGSAATGWNIYDPTSGKVLGTMAGKPSAPKSAAKPIITGSSTAGWTAHDPKTGKVLWTQPGAPASAKAPSASDAKGGLAALASAGGVDWKTGAMTPTFRKAARDYITRTTGADPGPIPATATPEQLARLQKILGVTPTAPKAKPAPRVKITGTSPSSKFVVTYNADGSVKSREPNPNYVPPKAKAAASTAKTRASALKAANSTALRIVTAGAKKTGVYGQAPKTDAFGGVVKGPDGKPVMTRTRTGDRYSASYYETIHRIEAAVEDQLAPYMSRSEIIRFAQRYANEYYPAGTGSRPRTAAQAEAAAPTPPTFPTPKAPKRRRPRVPNPRKQFQATFPSPFKVTG